jgi:UDP-N-acetylglucosamine 2-epimerase
MIICSDSMVNCNSMRLSVVTKGFLYDLGLFFSMKIVSVVGARPQFIKCAPVSRAVRKDAEEIIIHTGQHYDVNLSKSFFDDLHIPTPDYNLGVGSGTHGYQTGAMLKGIEDILLTVHPDIVLVYGDTNSTLAGALAAAKLHIPLAHIEAGLRSYNKDMPEEINRVVTDHCSDLFFCPTETAVFNLKKENIYKGVHLVGDVMYDALLYTTELAQKSPILQQLHLEPKTYILATLHRASNTDNVNALKRIMTGLSHVDYTVVFPAHPRTRKALKAFGISPGKNIFVTEPVGYLDFLKLESEAATIVTDSGGIQKEAYILRIPCITVRKETEWVETVEDGWNTLVGTDTDLIMRAVQEFRPDKGQRQLFGDGTAAQKIARILKEYR